MNPIINEFYSDLDKIPWISLGDYPTDVEKLERMGEARGFSNLFIKRDDRCNPVYGGNKVRKLEYILGDAKRKEKKTLISLGAVGSNQIPAIGIFGSELGFDAVGVLMDQPNALYVRENLLLDKYSGIKIVYAKNEVSEIITFLVEYLRTKLGGGKPYLVTPGISSELGNMGFVNAGFELKQQVENGNVVEPDYIIVPSGSIGTSAGLYLGCKLAGLKTRIIGVRVVTKWVVNKWRMARMIRDINRFMRRHDSTVPLVEVKKDDLILLEDYLGQDYAYFTDCGIDCVNDMYNLENLKIEASYTGKALGGGLDWLMKKKETDANILFWNTYNSIDFSEKTATVDYRSLPDKFHKYFTEPVQETCKG